MQKLRAEKGITLIALVITIIVMLILVGVSVTVALNGGLFTTAKEAAEGTASKRNEELELSSGKVEINGEWYNSIEEYVNGGSSNNPEEYTAYSVGDTVTIGTENFYVIADSDETQEKVTLLAKDCIDTTTLEQSKSYNCVQFLSNCEDGHYWQEGTDVTEPEPTLDETTGKLTLPASHIAAKAAYDYGTNVGGTGRLMTLEEAEALETANSDILFGTNGKSSWDSLYYWLGTSFIYCSIWTIDGSNGFGNLDHATDASHVGVRPIVEISKESVKNFV